ncbi:DNA polymerase theta-like [Babylonia areolata]|uniref:DNA polymerase theta-like n=1 Tax=Babylonia areolata TaxID=304850 RepID=UPI003FD11EF5
MDETTETHPFTNVSNFTTDDVNSGNGSYDLTSVAEEDEYSSPFVHAQHWMRLILLPFIYIFGVFGNVMTIAIVCRFQRTTYDRYFLCLAVSDLCVTIMGPLQVWMNTVTGVRLPDLHDVTCKLADVIFAAGSCVSAWLVLVMVIQRALSVVWPHRVNLICTASKSKKIMAVVYVASILFNCHGLYGRKVIDGRCVFRDDYLQFLNDVWFKIDPIIYSGIPLVGLMIGNTVLVVKLRTSVKEAGDQFSASENQQSKREKKVSSVTLTALLVSVCFIVFTMPLAVWNAIEFTGLKSTGEASAVPSMSVGLENPGCSFTSSFAVDFDPDVLKEVDSLEAAAYRAQTASDKDTSRSHPVPAKTPTRQKQTPGHASGTNPGKRKNARRSGVRKQSLFGDDSSAEVATPTHSPMCKKRKDCEQTLLTTTLKKCGLLCPATPSPEPQPKNQHHGSGSLSPAPFSSPREGVSHRGAKKGAAAAISSASGSSSVPKTVPSTATSSVSGSASVSKTEPSTAKVPGDRSNPVTEERNGISDVGFKSGAVELGADGGTEVPEPSRRVPSPVKLKDAAADADCRDADMDSGNSFQPNLASKSQDQHVSGRIGSQNAECLSLSSWGLPSPVLEAYYSQGITSMFPWQAECLMTGNVLKGGNLVYSAPTSAGKTMVAELLVLKRVLETRRKALFILPFVSVTREKMVSLQRLYQDAGVRVGGFMGGHSPTGGVHSVDVAVCTIEKGNGVVNRLMEENKVDELGVVVIDELHMVGDSNRGYLLELLLTKLCYMARRSRQNREHDGIQVIGMSATLPNLDLLASWLNADLYHSDFRPVPLTQHIKVGTCLYDEVMTKVRDIDVKTVFPGDEDHIVPLCLETIMGGHSVLIFCPTKAWCERMAEKIAREFYGLLKNPAALAAYTGETGFVKASEMARLPVDQESLRNVVEQLGRSPVGVDPMLGKVLHYAVAYHHAGLTFDERDIVEGAFRQGAVKVLVATSTLSSGVNLPARRVIVRSPLFGGRVIDALSYKQMAGRAGRKGVDTEGECVLVCKEGEKKTAQRLLRSELPPVASCLQVSAGDGCQLSRSMKRAVLEVVVSGVASTPEDVACYVECTLLSASLPSGDSSTRELVTACLSFLEDNEFVTLHTARDSEGSEVRKYQPTQLGSAVLASSMSPDEGLAVFAELQRARQCFVLANELHIIYLVTPIYSQEISGSLEWYHFYCLWDKLSPDMRLVAKTVGVEEAFLAKAITGRLPTKTAAQARAVAVHRRFYTALALHDLVQEVPLLEVAARYNCNKGQLQSLMQSAATFAGMVTVFCARLGWSNMELLLAQFQQRLTLGVTRELCDLVRIPLLTGSMARVLFNAGFQTVASVAHAVPEEVETVFRRASPFQSNKKQDGESDWELEQRRKARCMWLAGRKGVTELEAATAIITEAKTIIQQELGVQIQWGGEVGQAGEDGHNDTADLSASRTLLGHRPSDTSVPLKESPLQLGSRNGSVSSRESPAVVGSQQGTATSPECAHSKPQRRSPGEFQTPVGKRQGRRSLSSRSALKRASSGKSMSCRKSPLSDASTTEGRPGLQKTQSPKDVSFFGQVVVSPPPSLKPCRKTSPDVQRQGSAAAGNAVAAHSKPSPAVATTSQDMPAVNSSDLDSGEKDLLSPCRGLLQTSTDCTPRKNCLKKAQFKNTSQAMCIDTHPLILTSQSGGEVSSRYQKKKPGLTSSLGTVLSNTNAQALETEKEDRNSNAIMVEQPQHEDTDPLITVRNTVAADLPEKQTNDNHVQDQDYDCFDDSLILNTQTDNLLLGRLNDSHSTSEKTFENITASTPLASVQSVQKMSRDTTEVNRFVECRPDSASSSDHVSQREVDASHSDKKQLSAGWRRAGKTATQCAGSTSPTLTSPPHGSVHGPPTHPDCGQDSFTEDMFASPFDSLSHSGSDRHLSSGKSTEGKTLEGDVRKQNDENGTEHRQLQDGEGVMDDCDDGGSEAEDSVELIAASNYDRVAYMEEGMIDNSADGSFQCMATTAAKTGSSERLVCAERDPEERSEEPQTSDDVHNPGDYNMQEDLAIAAVMSDTFSSWNNGSAEKIPAVSADTDTATVQSHQSDRSSGDDFSTSFTMSMMEKAFADEPFTDSFSETLTVKERVPQKSMSHQNKSTAEVEPDDGITQSTTKRSPPSDGKVVAPKSSPAAKQTTVEAEWKLDRKNKTSLIVRKPSGHVASSTPRSSEEFVPPTPPEESSPAASSPLVSARRTPLRACRARGQGSCQQTPHASSSFHHDKKKRKAKDKENSQATRSTQHTLKKKTATQNSQTAKENAPKVKSLLQNCSDKTKTKSTDVGVSLQEQENQVSHVSHVRSSTNSPHVPSTIMEDKNTSPSSNNPLPDSNADRACAVIDLDSPPLTQDSLCIIDVCSNAQLFATFAGEWRSKQQYSISVACEKKASPMQIGAGIGSHFVQGGREVKGVEGSSRQRGLEVPGDEGRIIVGLAVSWAGQDAYYISLSPDTTEPETTTPPDDSLAAAPCSQSLSLEQRIRTVRDVLQMTENKRSLHTVVAFDAKSACTLLARSLGAVLGRRCRDPRVACWLLDPGAREKTLHSMVTNFLPGDLPLLEGIGGSKGYGSLGLTVEGAGSGRMRAVVESILARRLMDYFWHQMMEADLAAAFTDTEMPSVLTLARMELNGFGFSEDECESQKNLMMARLSALEQEAYVLAGHPFSLTSPDDIAQVLYLELHLPVNGDASSSCAAGKKAVRTLGPSRRAPRGGRHSKGPSFSTSKDVLEKLQSFHRLPAIVLEWRRISSALTKHVYPLMKGKVYSEALGMHRIFSECQTHTATGRVSLMEPNLQNIPRDFDILLPDVIGESPPALHGGSSHPASKARGKGGNSRLQAMRGAIPQTAHVSDPATATHMAVSMRHAFVPFPGGVILAADYSQLELRVIAHLSGDAKLISVLNNDGDVFKLIAAQWKNTEPEAVTAEERQHAKQICYGMLYGIGPKALGEQIGVDENDAVVFMESFKAKYTGMRSYLRKTVERCRESGYVMTVTGRRRYLPAIKDTNPHARAQAERQAVNTTVQGSAADIVKAAMNAIDRELAQAFPDTRFPHRHCHAEADHPRGAFLVLQLHDELIYEASGSDVQQVAAIVKRLMETTTPLSVRLPVKVKVGPSWGRLHDMEL